MALPPVTASPTGEWEALAELVPDTPPPEEEEASAAPLTPEEATEAVSGHSEEAPKEELKVEGPGLVEAVSAGGMALPVGEFAQDSEESPGASPFTPESDTVMVTATNFQICEHACLQYKRSLRLQYMRSLHFHLRALAFWSLHIYYF